MTAKSNRVALIMNPTAKSGHSKKHWNEMRELLFKYNIQYDEFVSSYAGESMKLAKNAANVGYKAIVAVGGDGTINEVLNGLMMSIKKVPLGILYTGTSPDICKYHGIPLDHEAAVKALSLMKTRAVDLGKINFSHKLLGKCDQFFLCSVNLGLGPLVAEGSNSGLRKLFGDKFGTLFSILSALRKFHTQIFRAEIDGRSCELAGVYNLTIGKNPLIASGLKLGIEIGHSDGRGYLFSLQGYTLWELLKSIPKFYNGSVVKDSCNKLTFFHTIKISCETDERRVEFDGDFQGYLPALITIDQQKLELIVP